MKKNILLAISVLLFLSVSAQENIILNNNISGSNQVRIARDYVEMRPGFEFSAIMSDFYFLAKTNPDIILPVNYDKPITTWTTNLPVGSLPGTANVSPTGAASYQIPIEVPPGTAGMQPNLSIAYSSQSPDGLLGVGWTVTGLSAITRAPATLYHNGFIDGVDFDDNDQFALDGQRLICVNGEYGKQGSRYRTEIESFSDIELTWATQNSGAQKFKVTTKNGTEMQYAYTENSRIQTTKPNDWTINFWLLNEIKDPLGNYMKIEYLEQDGVFYPKRIDYTGNSNTGLATYNSVRFYYEERADKSFAYIGGGGLETKLVLYKIVTYSGDKAVKTYLFNYAK